MFKFDISRRISTGMIKSNAIQVFVLSGLTLYFQSFWPLLILALDFSLRAFNQGKISPTTIVSKKILLPLLKLESKMTSLAPKVFAARIGFTLSVISFLSYVLEYYPGFIIPIILLSVFSFLEAFFGFCAGCKVYGLLIHWKVFDETECVDCKIN